MKKFSFLFFLVTFWVMGSAQFVQLADGPVFEDPGPGYARILQMKNYNTMFLHVTFNKGITVHIYEALYKAKTETLLEPAYGKPESGKVEGIFEVNNDVVAMISISRNDELALYRLIIDGKTGKLKEEKKIASVKKQKVKTEKGNPEPLTGVVVRKDPASEHYAVAVFNRNVTDTGRQIEVMLYGKDNMELHRSYYTGAKEVYKNLQFIDMIVIGDEKVGLLFYGYNRGPAGEKAGDLLFTSLDREIKTMMLKELNYSNDLVVENGIMRYDSKIERIVLLTNSNLNSEPNNKKTYFGIIDPRKRALVSHYLATAGEKISNAYQEFYGNRAVYKGMAQNLVVNNDGTYTIIFEETEITMQKDTVSHSSVRNTAVVTYDIDANISTSYFIPLDHHIRGMAIPAFYQSGHQLAGQQLLNDYQYKTSTYISDGHQQFLLFNDNAINAKTVESGSVSEFKELAFADGFYCNVSGKDTRLKREFIFGKPQMVSGKLQHQPGVFSVYDYDRANNMLVMLRQDQFRDQAGYKLVWLQP